MRVERGSHDATLAWPPRMRIQLELWYDEHMIESGELKVKGHEKEWFFSKIVSVESGSAIFHPRTTHVYEVRFTSTSGDQFTGIAPVSKAGKIRVDLQRAETP